MRRTRSTSRRSSALRAALACAVVLLGVAATPARATPNQFGAQDRADAASRMIVIGVQQGISSLPPTSGQSFVYDFDPAIDTYVASPRLGPISFRTPLTVGKGRFSLRLAGSYFQLSKRFGPMDYSVTNRADGMLAAYTQFGLEARATVGLLNFGVTYGIADTLEVNMNFPIAIVHAHADQTFPTRPDDPPGTVRGTPTLGLLHDQLADGSLVTRRETFTASGHDFNEGTSAGLGRVSLGARWLAYAREGFRAAASLELFLPSPDEEEFAGSESAAILPRLIAMYEISEDVRLHLDAGYDYDFSVDELSRFTWNAGSSVAIPGFTVDFGVGGSEFDKAIQWTPKTAIGVGGSLFPQGADLAALGDTRLGTNYIDFLGGLKVKIADYAVVGGSVTVPLTSDGFRADAVGTVATEVYF